jgi:hypothetical protein
LLTAPLTAATESHKRLVVTCSEGCSLLFHFPYCWRHFKDTYRQNVNDKFEDILNKGQVGTQKAAYNPRVVHGAC